MTVVVTVTRITPRPAGAGRVVASRRVAEAAMSVSIAGPRSVRDEANCAVGLADPSTPALLRKCIIFALRLRN
ncbi:MAG: hypothetical protein RKE49_13520 [Oceanicaulis sp.]